MSFVLGPSTLRQPGNQGDVSTDIYGPWLPDGAVNLNWSLCAHDPFFQPPEKPGVVLRSQPAPQALTPAMLLSVTATRSPRLPAFRTHNASGAPGVGFVWFLGKLFIIEDHKLLGPIPKEYQILKSVSLRDPPAQLTSTKFPLPQCP